MSRRSRQRETVWQAKHYQAENDDLSQAFQEMQEATRKSLARLGAPLTKREHDQFMAQRPKEK